MATTTPATTKSSTTTPTSLKTSRLFLVGETVEEKFSQFYFIFFKFEFVVKFQSFFPNYISINFLINFYIYFLSKLFINFYIFFILIIIFIFLIYHVSGLRLLTGDCMFAWLATWLARAPRRLCWMCKVLLWRFLLFFQ